MAYNGKRYDADVQRNLVRLLSNVVLLDVLFFDSC